MNNLDMSEVKPPVKEPVQPKPEKPEFTIKPVKEKPKRAYRKGSKYDPIIEAFLKSKDKMVTLSIEGKEANYIRTQIDKRLTAKGVKTITVSVVNNICYLEKA